MLHLGVIRSAAKRRFQKPTEGVGRKVQFDCRDSRFYCVAISLNLRHLRTLQTAFETLRLDGIGCCRILSPPGASLAWLLARPASPDSAHRPPTRPRSSARST